MDWIKRNLFFVIGGLVALGLMGGAGYYNWSGWSANAAAREKLNSNYEELKRLYGQNPLPGDGKKVDNVKAAREQKEQVLAMLAQAGKQFAPISAIPDTPKVSGEDFAAALRRTLDQLSREATNQSVGLPPSYAFSFERQGKLLKFSPGSLEKLAVQLGEVKAICDVLLQAKINSLESIRRERVSNDDQEGPQTDYFDKATQTNDLAVITPYEVTFHCFTPELAAALSGFSSSPHSLVIKGINVEPAPTTQATESQPAAPVAVYQPVIPTPTYPLPNPEVSRSRSEGGEGAAFARRYGIKGPGYPTPTPAAPVYAAPAAPRPGLQTVLNEKQLRVTMLVEVVKLRTGNKERGSVGSS